VIFITCVDFLSNCGTIYLYIPQGIASYETETTLGDTNRQRRFLFLNAQRWARSNKEFMSDIDRSVLNEHVIPIFETDMFDGHEDARFGVGIIAVGDEVVPGREAEFTAYKQLRGKVYARQTRMISTEALDHDDSETDDDDSRSVHFGIYEQWTPDEITLANRARSLGAIRLIIKSAADGSVPTSKLSSLPLTLQKPGNGRPLPVEDFFPEAFERKPAPPGSTEASRLIARHESAVVQGAVKWTSYAAAEAYILSHDLGPTYATVEPGLETDFRRSRMPFERIAPPKYVPEYAADNLGLVIDTNGFAEVVRRVKPGMLEGLTEHEGEFFFYGKRVPALAPAPRTVPLPETAVA
jgi:hypothetical protein